VRRALKLGIGGTVVAVVAVAFALFRPDTLFVDRVVDDEIDDDVVSALADLQAPPEGTTAPDDAGGQADSSTGEGAPGRGDGVDPSAVEGPRVLATGEWRDLDHPTSGTVAVVESEGSRSLVFADLRSDNGPDLHVYLSPADPAAEDPLDGAVRIGGLKGNLGDQVYPLPDGIEIERFRSVLIWCDRFSVGFGVAPLGPV
jgi:hypothetical protein